MSSSKQHGKTRAWTGKSTTGMPRATALPSRINLNPQGMNLLSTAQVLRKAGKPQPSLIAQSAPPSHLLRTCKFATPHLHPKTTLTVHALSPQNLPLPQFRSLLKLLYILEVPVTSGPSSRRNHNVHIAHYLPTHLHSQESTHSAPKAPSGLGPVLPFPSPLPTTFQGHLPSPSIQPRVRPAIPAQNWILPHL